MRGSFFASLGLHALAVAVMIWASMASEPKAKALPSATVVKLIKPQGLPLPRGNPVAPPQGEGSPDERPMQFPKVDKTKKPVPPPEEPPSKTVPKLPTQPQNPSKHPGMPNGKEVSGPAGTIVVGNGFDYDYYLAVIQTKISQNFRPPPGVRAQSLASMTFTIMKGGDISNVKLAQSSGNLLIDQAAERAIRAAGHFPPLPSQYDQGRLDIYFEFVINPSTGR
ncbi:MAG TPA: TonB family protein [bacterium]